MKNIIEQKKDAETTVLVGVVGQYQTEIQTEEYLNELAFLARTAGVEPLKHFTQKLETPNPKTFIGTGKLEEIRKYMEENEVEMIIFDDELSPSQIRNIEKIVNGRVIDRTNLILDIFAQRAQTSHAKVQVELAQYQYLLPRLAGLWTHLERQKGGIGLRGPGEREIETDRRIIRDKIAHLKEQLSKIDKQMATQRKNRGKMIRVALVGYTNVGKSTLMNMLSKSDVFAENKLFATLDTTVRKVVIDNLPFLMSDTVGFIRKLPTTLVEAFKSTLDEVREADILLHVVDISHPNHEEQIEVVESTLNEIGCADTSSYLIFNKIDQYTYIKKDDDDLTERTKENWSLEEMKKSYMAQNYDSCIFISAKKRTNLEQLKNMIYNKVKDIHTKRYPYNNFLY